MAAPVSHQIVHHPQQILDANALQIGVIVGDYELNQYSGKYLLISKPFQSDDKKWWINVINCDTGRIESRSLSDRSIKPYENGKWNPTNYFVYIGKSSAVNLTLSVHYIDLDGQEVSHSKSYPMGSIEKIVQRLSRP